ncbi:hypothetical protein V6C27_03450 [Peptococcaceae bacterium 1198_IL3148]
MYLALDELIQKTKTFRALILKIYDQLPEETNFDRLLVLVCMGKGGFLSLESLPNQAIMNMICESTELFEEILPFLDQQFLYQCMDKGTKAEMMQCIYTVKQNNVAKAVREEYYFKAVTIFYQVLFENICHHDELWEEFVYRLVTTWNSFNKDFLHRFRHHTNN